MTAKSREALRKHSSGRTDQLLARLEKARKVIEQEIEQAEGLYPFNGGRLSEAEVLRRANIARTTLLHPRHKSTRQALKTWLATVRSGVEQGADSVRRTVTQRADDWKARYQALATAMHILKLDAISRDQKLAAARDEIARLTALSEALQVQVAEGRVSRLPRRSSKSNSAGIPS